MLQKKTAEQRRGQLQRCASKTAPEATRSKRFQELGAAVFVLSHASSEVFCLSSSYIEDCQRTLSYSTLKAQCSQTSSSWEPLVKHWDAASGQKGARGEIMRQSST